MTVATRTREEFISALSEVMEIVGYVKKDGWNDHQKYKYASAEHVFEKVRAALAERQMAVESAAELLHFEIFDTPKGKRSMAVIRMTLTITDGQNTATMQGIGQGIDAGDKAVMKANTAALKYAPASGFLISWGDDPEADPATDRDQVREGVQQESRDAFAEDVGIPVEYPIFAKLVALHKGKKGINDLRMVGVEAKRLGWKESKLLAWISEQGVDLNNGANYSDYVKLRSAIKRVEVK